MVSIRYGRSIATYDSNGWTSSDRSLAEMLNALGLNQHVSPADGRPDLAVARKAIAQLRAGEIVEISVDASMPAGTVY